MPAVYAQSTNLSHQAPAPALPSKAASTSLVNTSVAALIRSLAPRTWVGTDTRRDFLRERPLALIAVKMARRRVFSMVGSISDALGTLTGRIAALPVQPVALMATACLAAFLRAPGPV